MIQATIIIFVLFFFFNIIIIYRSPFSGFRVGIDTI